jgi:hypothetical protein
MESKHSEGITQTAEKSIKSMKWLIIVFIVVGIIQIQIAVITLFFILRLK